MKNIRQNYPKKINFIEFKNYSLILDRFLLFDEYNLMMLYEHDCQLKDMQDAYGTANRLISLGMAYNLNGYLRNPITQNISYNPPKNDISITEFGRKFYQYGFKEYNNIK